MKPRVAWNWQMVETYMIKVQEIDNTTNIHVQWYKLDTLKNLKLHFKMLQNISLIVCIKKKSTMFVFLQNKFYCWKII